jgi:predicted DNA binding CopG/RHH family protein
MRTMTGKTERQAKRDASKAKQHGKAGRPVGSYTAPDSVTCRIPSHCYRAVKVLADAEGVSFVAMLAELLATAIPARLGSSEVMHDAKHVL